MLCQVKVLQACLILDKLWFIKGICATLSLPIYFVRPSKWKKHFDLIKTSKDASRTKAIEMYPQLSNELLSKKRCK